MTDHANPPDDSQDLGPIDGVHELLQRRITTLWYRSIRTEAVPLRPIARSSAQRPVGDPEESQSAVSMADQLAEIARFAIAAGKRAEARGEDVSVASPAAEGEPPVWRVVPESCPALMLSASSTLGGQIAAAQLAPGIQFRVASLLNGVAEVEVLSGDGETVRGYCNTVDLACAHPDHPSVRPRSGKPRAPKTSRFRISNLSQSFGSLR